MRKARADRAWRASAARPPNPNARCRPRSNGCARRAISRSSASAGRPRSTGSTRPGSAPPQIPRPRKARTAPPQTLRPNRQGTPIGKLTLPRRAGRHGGEGTPRRPMRQTTAPPTLRHPGPRAGAPLLLLVEKGRRLPKSRPARLIRAQRKAAGPRITGSHQSTTLMGTLSGVTMKGRVAIPLKVGATSTAVARTPPPPAPHHPIHLARQPPMCRHPGPRAGVPLLLRFQRSLR